VAIELKVLPTVIEQFAEDRGRSATGLQPRSERAAVPIGPSVPDSAPAPRVSQAVPRVSQWLERQVCAPNPRAIVRTEPSFIPSRVGEKPRTVIFASCASFPHGPAKALRSRHG